MGQTLNLSVAGEYTSSNDFNGLPPGALNRALNVESRYKNLLEPRRGFEGLANSSRPGTVFTRLVNFIIDGQDRTVGLTETGELHYYTGASPWPAVPGNYSSNIIAPDSVNAKSRFIRANQNLYVTSKDGIRSISSGAGAQTLKAGVPKGLNLEAVTNGSLSGFFDNNQVLSTTGNITSGAAQILHLGSSTGVTVGQYVSGTDIAAKVVIQSLTYTAIPFGVLGNAITIAYTTGATAGAEVVTVVGNAISVQIASGVSTATQVKAAVSSSTAASQLVSVSITGIASTAQTAPVSVTSLFGGVDNTIPIGTKVLSFTEPATLIIETGTTTAGSTTVSALTSNAGLVAGVLVSGAGIPEGASIVGSPTGSGPYSIVLSLAAFQTATGVNLTFQSAPVLTMDHNAVVSASGTTISFYSGSQVGYRIVFGRVETDSNGNTITRLGAPSAVGIANNISPYPTNVTITAVLPKNCADSVTFYQLYRSTQTASISITPLDQYNLVEEFNLTPTNFTDRVITITDDTPDSLKGIPLYAGSDVEGILQANDPPPMAWDMCAFRDFAIYANVTQPTTLKFTVISVGAPNGVQIGDTITVSGTFVGVPFSQVYTAASIEDQAAREFQIITSGTPSQNITDTVNSFIRVFNYDNSLPIHAILLSSSTDLPGQILLEADNPGYDTFTATASAHTGSYDPVLTGVASEVNAIRNGIVISKSGQLESTPKTNLLRAGDSSYPILRVIPLRDYVFILKSDGIYKLQGFTPNGLVINPFDLTTKIVGADTAVALNSSVWMLSNQGVVTASDGGVEAKSPPIDDQLNLLLGSFLDTLRANAFAIGYESDRKYILSVPTSDDPITNKQHVFNYVTNSWTRWDRRLRAAYVNSADGKLYISRADNVENGISRERKTGRYQDFVDEAVAASILSVSGSTVILLTADDVSIGDIVYQSSTQFSPVIDVIYNLNKVILESDLNWTVGAIEVRKAYSCEIEWKQISGDNPAFVRQFSEGLALFKNTRFNTAILDFVTDYSGSSDPVTVYGTGNGLWGLFGWGEVPFGTPILPDNIRFLIPQNKQLGSYLVPSLKVKQGYSDFKFQGLAITYFNVSPEVGL